MRSLLRLFENIPHAWRIPVLGGAALLLVVLLWFYGVSAWNGIGSRFYDWRVSVAKKDIQDAKAEAAEAKQVAAGWNAAFEAEKTMRKEEEAKRAILEKVLADRTKTTDQKLAAYQAALDARPVVTGPESDAELCRRAVALGIAVRCD